MWSFQILSAILLKKAALLDTANCFVSILHKLERTFMFCFYKFKDTLQSCSLLLKEIAYFFGCCRCWAFRLNITAAIKSQLNIILFVDFSVVPSVFALLLLNSFLLQLRFFTSSFLFVFLLKVSLQGRQREALWLPSNLTPASYLIFFFLPSSPPLLRTD